MTRAPVNVGDRFGRLVVLAVTARTGGGSATVRCDCGVERRTECGVLRRGGLRSCGCLHRDTLTAGRAKARKHGHYQSPEYRCWYSMIRRCTDARHHAWHNYGGRGIAVCPAWRNSFEAFLADMGLRPSLAHSLDRIDNDRGYEPGNVRWATAREQRRNARTNRQLTWNGETLPLVAWAERQGIHKSTLLNRLNRGWPVARALTAPVHHEKGRRRAC